VAALTRIFKSSLAALIFRFFLGGLFVYASLHKIINPQEFAQSIYYYHFLPGVFVNLFAIFLPWVELAAGMALILGVMVEAASLITGSMLVVFIIALTSAALRGLDISCGCFSSSTHSSGNEIWVRIIQDLLLLIITVQVYFGHGGVAGLGRFLERKKNTAN
jgi:uncharacterized membrane protein YphA (DoxX/SURF4 family)